MYKCFQNTPKVKKNVYLLWHKHLHAYLVWRKTPTRLFIVTQTPTRLFIVTQTPTRLFIVTQTHNLRIFGVISFVKLQNDT